MTNDPQDLNLSASQVKQFVTFIEDNHHEGAVVLRQMPEAAGYLQIVLKDDQGNESDTKRTLFPDR